MGKSDPFIFEEYLSVLRDYNDTSVNSVAFLGFPCENNLTRHINGRTRHFYDRSIDNWEINSPWTLQKSYDLIVCTRCAYFSKDPQDFFYRCMNSLQAGGRLLVDWGLGDHWRFRDYKVGWVRNGEHEHAYAEDNLLYSCYWNDNLKKDEETKKFWLAVKSEPSFGYNNNDNIENVVSLEVPCLIDYPVDKMRTKFLWPDRPQLYIMTLVKKKD